MLHPTKYADDHIVMLLWQHAWFLPLQNEILPFATQQSKYLVLSKTYGSHTFHWVSSLTFLYLLPRVATNGIIIHQTHYEKSDWSRAFNQFTIACELDMINAMFAADTAFIMSSSTSAWLLSSLECSPQKQNG